jgi:hypothetical protein
MSRRSLGVLCGLLVFSTGFLSWYAWRLHTRLNEAEYYVQSGVESVFYICSPVLQDMLERRANGPDPAMLGIARECIGQVPDSEAQAMSDEFQHKDITAITKRLKAKLDDRDLPYRTASPVTNRLFPIGYRE